jgi:hypothetical protein
MDLPTTSIAPRLVPLSTIRTRPVGQRSILNPASVVVPAARPQETVPSIFDTTVRGQTTTDLFGTTVPSAPRADQPRRIVTARRSFGLDVSTSPSIQQLQAQQYAETMGREIDAQKAQQAQARALLAAPPAVAPPPVVVSKDLTPPAPAVAAPAPSFLTQHGTLVAGLVAAAAIGGVVAWKMGVFKKKGA